MPNTHPCKLVVIVTESVLEEALAKDIMRLGAHGYTLCDVRGEGTHGNRGALWAADRSIRMEVLCDSATALAITTHVEKAYFKNYAMVAFVADVGVLRPTKFVGQPSTP